VYLCVYVFLLIVTGPATLEMSYCDIIIAMGKQNVFAVLCRFEMWSLILREESKMTMFKIRELGEVL
jgi:hypothetical protein